jgi:metallo-beta-lactamase family protein
MHDMATLRFLGAAQEVTGSCHLLSAPAIGRVLFDCGMHQGGDAIERLHEEQFEFAPQEIDVVILSHAHLDHSGMLPKLVQQGFTGPIYCTSATTELLDIMLNDAANIYEHDLERENRRRARQGEPPLSPCYDKRAVNQVLRQCVPSEYGVDIELNPDARVRFHDAGHILGSAIVELVFQDKGQSKTLVFSGDLGKKNAVLMNDPTPLDRADTLLVEGTYGDRDHRDDLNTIDQFATILHETWRRGGNVMIPAFAVGRTQELLFDLGRLRQQGKLDNWQIFLDSPMAIAVTKVYDRWLHTMDCKDVKKLCDGDQSLLKDFLPRLSLSVTPEDSIAINRIQSGAIIIAGSGMCTGGRIQHHFKQRIWNPNNTLIFVGYQARGTLGRLLVDGIKSIRMFGEEFKVNARIETLGGFSAHAGQSELVEWIRRFGAETQIKLVHGEPEALDGLAQKLWKDHGLRADIPALRSSHAF